jgi:hypothetical protein
VAAGTQQGDAGRVSTSSGTPGVDVLVGRQRELNLLSRAWSDAAAGRGRLVPWWAQGSLEVLAGEVANRYAA